METTISPNNVVSEEFPSPGLVASTLVEQTMNLLKEYDAYILKNAAQISSIESALRTITYILPSRFKDAELASETLYTTLNLVSLYHDSLLAKAVANLPPSVRKPEPTPHNRYTQFWTKASPSYKRLALAIVLIQYAEVLLEMNAKKKWGEKGRWRTIVGIEALKVICRFGLLSLTKARPLVSPPLPAREIDPKAFEELANSPHAVLTADFPSPTLSATSSHSDDDPNHPYTLPRTGLTLPSLSSTAGNPFSRTDGITSYLSSRVLTVEDIKPAAQLLPRLNGLSWYAEVLYILRPLLYALIMQRWVRKRGEQHARQSWWPWLLGLSIEYAAMELRKRDQGRGYRSGLGRLEKDEQRQRGKAMWWWALRGAMYENVSKPVIDGFVRKIERVPLLNIAGGIIQDYQYLWENYYFPTASM